MCDLVLFLNEVEFWEDAKVIPEFRLSHGEEVLNRVLHSPIDLPLMQYPLESLEDGIRALWSQLRQHLPNLDHEVASDVNRVLRRVLEEESKHLQPGEIREDLLVD